MCKPTDKVCAQCGGDDVYVRTEVLIPLNGDEKDFEYSEYCEDTHLCSNCSDGDTWVVDRNKYAEESKLDGPWIFIEHLYVPDPLGKGNHTCIYRVRGFQQNGEHVATWEGLSKGDLKQTMGPETITLGHFCNVQDAFSKCR